MPEPIKIVVYAQTDEAAKKIKDFAAGAGMDLGAGFKKGAAEAENFVKRAGNARAGLMELEHTARASADIMLMGGNPRWLLAQIPQMIQGLSEMGVGLSTLLPWIAAVGAAVGAGYLGWKEYMSGVNDTTEEIKKMTDALDKVPALLEKIQSLTKSGLISQAAGTEFADYLGKNPKKPLYRKSDGTITPIPTETTLGFSRTGDPFLDQKMREIEKQLPRATPDEAQKYVEQQLIITAAQKKAAEEYRAALQKANEEIATGVDKSVAQIHEKFGKEIEDLQTKLQVMVKMGLNGPNDQKATEAKIAQLRQAEAAAVAEARQKFAAEQARKDQQTQAQWSAEKKQIVSTQEKALEDAILANRQQTKDKSVELYQLEYNARAELYRRELADGVITEDELTHKIEAAETQRIAGEKAYQAELQKPRQLKEEVARAETEGKLRAIQSNPYLTDNEKANQSVPLYKKRIGQNVSSLADLNQQYSASTDEAARLELKKQIAAITEQQYENEIKLREAQGHGSWQQSYIQNLIQLKNQWQNISVSLTNGAFNLIHQGIQGIANALTNVIMGTQSAGAAFAQFATSLISSFIEMVLEAILWAKVAIPILTYLGVVSGGTTTATGSAVTIAAIGAAMVTAGSVMAAEGGLVTGPGTSTSDSIPAMLSNREFVVNADAVQRIGVDTLHAINRGESFRDPATSGTGAGGRLAGGNVNLHVWDKRPSPKEYLNSEEGQHHFVELSRKLRLKIGVRT